MLPRLAGSCAVATCERGTMDQQRFDIDCLRPSEEDLLFKTRDAKHKPPVRENA